MSNRIGGVTVGPGQMSKFSFSTTIYHYTCRTCGQPGTDNQPNTRTHPGACREEARRRGKARAKRKANS